VFPSAAHCDARLSLYVRLYASVYAGLANLLLGDTSALHLPVIVPSPIARLLPACSPSFGAHAYSLLKSKELTLGVWAVAPSFPAYLFW
jgi:hypothetical protein